MTYLSSTRYIGAPLPLSLKWRRIFPWRAAKAAGDAYCVPYASYLATIYKPSLSSCHQTLDDVLLMLMAFRCTEWAT